ncbi:ComEC/Rec2 family competence protein [Aestuariibius insulae]|uniref:ComEC/Rec2 family competence protein n=1 Tax=Aestuariibius insulae TaxID=2058287 RepID=UPI00345E4492
MPSWIAPLDAVAAQRGHLFLWVPVAFGLGIGWYFGVKTEPDLALYGSFAGSAVLCAALARWGSESVAPFFVALAVVLCGFCWAGLRANSVAEPVLGWRYYGPVEGRIVKIDRSQSDKVRLTLDRVVLSRVSPERTPDQVRMSLHGEQGFVTPEPGLTVILTGHLSPPSGPVEPGGFDFQRMAWFAGIGAVGYTRTPGLVLEPAEDGQAGLGIYRLRRAVSAYVQDAVGGEPGAVAAAIVTGDRSAMKQETLDALRASNLAHLLAISGLHMGLLTAFVFTLARAGLAMVPAIALVWPIKKIAAVVALVAGAAYLAMSGGNVATERAFIMVAVVFLAILLGRRALTLRAVAMAAMIVLLLRPEALFGPGFQMSFAATTALIVVFRALRDFERASVPKWARPVLAVVISSAVAGAATAPFSALHFNQISHYGLLANVTTVPLMGILVMPAAVLAFCLSPLGLDWIGFWGMEIGLRWILFVAQWVAGLEGALGHIWTPGPLVLPALTLGLLWICLWRGPARWGGTVPVAAAFVLWAQTERPAVLIDESGALIGLMTEAGRDLNKSKGQGFAARSWLENDGDGVEQESAYGRAGLEQEGKRSMARIGPAQVLHVAGKTAAAALEGCNGSDVLVLSVPAESAYPCDLYDPVRLRETGAVAFYLEEGGLKVVTARDRSGSRLWNSRDARRTELRLALR